MGNRNEFAVSKHRFFGRGAWPILAGVLVFSVLVLIDQLSMYIGFEYMQRIWDDLAGGIVAGLLIFIHERRRVNYVAERLRVIELMNHHVRNALQAIKYARYTQNDINVIEDSVARVEWALREILPGEFLPRKAAPGSVDGSASCTP
jgi:hypothetical protein